MESQNNKALSTNYQTPQIKPSNSLVEVVKNNHELIFVKSISVPNISELGRNISEKLLDTLAKWRWMAGISTHNQSEDDIAHELALICKFVMSNYPQITLDEISLAIDLSLTDKLNCDVRTFNTFSPMYVSRILNAYIEYKRTMYNDLMKRKESLDLKKEMDREITPEEKMEGMVELIRYFYDKHKSEGIVNDYFNTLYNYLRRTKRLIVGKPMIDDALKYAKVESQKHIKQYFEDSLKTQKIDSDAIEKRYARNYCVQVFFNTLDIEKLIASIKVEEFI